MKGQGLFFWWSRASVISLFWVFTIKRSSDRRLIISDNLGLRLSVFFFRFSDGSFSPIEFSELKGFIFLVLCSFFVILVEGCFYFLPLITDKNQIFYFLVELEKGEDKIWENYGIDKNYVGYQEPVDISTCSDFRADLCVDTDNIQIKIKKNNCNLNSYFRVIQIIVFEGPDCEEINQNSYLYD